MTPAEQAARIRERHAQFQRQYSPGPDWEPFNQTHQDRGWLLEEVERLTQAIEQAVKEAVKEKDEEIARLHVAMNEKADDNVARDWSHLNDFIEQARREEREAYAAIFDYAVNSQAAHHSEVCDCGLCRAIAAIRARAQEEQG